MRLFSQSGSFTKLNSLLLLMSLSSAVLAGDLLENTIDTGENLFDRDPMILLGSGLASSYLIYKVESPQGYGSFLQGDVIKSLDTADDFLFGPVLPASAACVWIAGSLSGSSETEETGESLCRGLLYTYGITGVLKLTTRRERPDHSDNLSFPSAHSAGAACTAAVLWSEYGASAGIPAAAIALYTCLSRVNTGRHFPSDAIMGAAVGTACGLAASLEDSRDGREKTVFSISLTIDTEGRISPTVW